MRHARILLPFLFLAPAGCAVVPPAGPSVLALPPPGRDLQRFQGEDAWCRNYAFGQIGYGPGAQAVTQAGVGSAAAGTALGAAAGALIGSASGQAGAGAAVGAGTGLVAGSVVGANAAGATTAGLQARYDAAYAQCMTSAGNTVQPLSYGIAAPYGYGYAYPQPYYWPYYWGPSVSLGFYGGYGGYRWPRYPYYYRGPYGWRR